MLIFHSAHSLAIFGSITGSIVVMLSLLLGTVSKQTAISVGRL